MIPEKYHVPVTALVPGLASIAKDVATDEPVNWWRASIFAIVGGGSMYLYMRFIGH